MVGADADSRSRQCASQVRGRLGKRERWAFSTRAQRETVMPLLFRGLGRGRAGFDQLVAAGAGFALRTGDQEGDEAFFGGLREALEAAKVEDDLFEGLALFLRPDG